MQIVAYAWERHPSSHCRALNPLLELSQRGHAVALNSRLEHLTPSDAELREIVESFDIAYIARYNEPPAVELARRLTDAGLPVAWDFDDDVLASRRDRTDTESIEYMAGIRAMLDVVDVVTTTSERLAERFLEEGARYSIPIPNFIAREHLNDERRPHDGIVLGYIGWVDHQQDWEALELDEVVKELLEDVPELRVELVGPIDFGFPAERSTRTEVVLYPELGRYIAGFDLAVAPLADIPANHMRSDIKLKEYAIAGVPWLASPVGPYLGHGEQQGGELVEDDGWYEALHRLIHDKRRRRKLGRKGQKWALDHTLPRNAHLWEEAFFETIEVAEKRRAAA
jgi:glycosyltransferase involved in cell wall biosynthesis